MVNVLLKDSGYQRGGHLAVLDKAGVVKKTSIRNQTTWDDLI